MLYFLDLYKEKQIVKLINIKFPVTNVVKKNNIRFYGIIRKKKGGIKMYKGKYVIVSIEELKNLISKYTNNKDIKLNCCYENESQYLTIVIDSKNITKELLIKIVGKDSSMLDEYIDESKYSDEIHINTTEAGYMFKEIFSIKEDVYFDDECLYTNNNEDVYLFYI